jgi:hypothetical protein
MMPYETIMYIIFGGMAAFSIAVLTIAFIKEVKRERNERKNKK